MTRRRVLLRWLGILVIGLLPSLIPAPADAAPSDLGELPTQLRKYVPGSPAWSRSAWMTSAACVDRGGDFSLWASHVVADIPRLLPVFYTELFRNNGNAQDRRRAQAVVDGFTLLADEFRDVVPSGYCVDEMTRWAGASPEYKPFGFAWGVTHQSRYACTDGRLTERDHDADNRWVGAERAPCDGFAISCDGAHSAQQARCEAWNAFSIRFTARGQERRDDAISRFPATATAAFHTETAWSWLAVVLGAGVLALTGLVALSRRRRRTPTRVRDGGDVAA